MHPRQGSQRCGRTALLCWANTSGKCNTEDRSGPYLHWPGTGCCRPSLFSLVPGSRCLAGSLPVRALLSLPAGLSSSKLRSWSSHTRHEVCLRCMLHAQTHARTRQASPWQITSEISQAVRAVKAMALPAASGQGRRAVRSPWDSPGPAAPERSPRRIHSGPPLPVKQHAI